MKRSGYLCTVLRPVGEKPQYTCGESRLVRDYVIEHVVKVKAKYAVGLVAESADVL